MGGKGEMGLRLFPINDSTITSRSTTNMLKEFAFFLHFMCENNSNLSSSAEIQEGKSLLGSVDLKFSPVYEKNGQPCSQGQSEAGAVSGKGFLDSGLCVEVLASSGDVTVLPSPTEGV